MNENDANKLNECFLNSKKKKKIKKDIIAFNISNLEYY